MRHSDVAYFILMRCVAFILTWLVCMVAWRIYMWYGSFRSDTTHSVIGIWLRDMSHSYLWMRHMSHSYLWMRHIQYLWMRHIQYLWMRHRRMTRRYVSFIWGFDTFICDVTYLYVGVTYSCMAWRLKMWCVTWLIHMWHDSFICDMTHWYVACLIHMCDMTHSYVWRDSFICDMPHLYVTWLIHMWHASFICEMPHSYVIWLTHTWYDWLIRM